jgi:hypothetical protein
MAFFNRIGQTRPLRRTMLLQVSEKAAFAKYSPPRFLSFTANAIFPQAKPIQSYEKKSIFAVVGYPVAACFSIIAMLTTSQSTHSGPSAVAMPTTRVGSDVQRYPICSTAKTAPPKGIAWNLLNVTIALRLSRRGGAAKLHSGSWMR